MTASASVPMIAADPTADYEVKEIAILIAAAAFAIVLASVAVAAIAICGWKGAKNVTIDWYHAKATFDCR